MRRREALSTIVGSISLASCGGNSDSSNPLQSQASSATCNITTSAAAGAKINMSAFYQTAAQPQYQNLWCWAACIAMIFAYKGRPVTQQRIVSEAYGAPYNMSAPGIVIANSLNRTWTDNAGLGFTCLLTGIYDAYAGVSAISDATIVNSLASGTPMVIGVGQHALVLTEIDYVSTASGPQIAGGQVFDPWTGSSRCLNASELTLAARGGSLVFIASVVISTR